MQSNPYAPPTAHVADHVPKHSGLRSAAVAMIVFFLISSVSTTWVGSSAADPA